MTEADLIVSQQQRDWWQAKCRHCKRWLTKYDFSRAEAIDLALSIGHACSGVPLT